MSELVLRSAVERLRCLVLAEETARLNGSAMGNLNGILQQLKQMQVLLKGKTRSKERELQIEELVYQTEDVIESYHVSGGIKMNLNRNLCKIRSKMKKIIKQIELDKAIVAATPVLQQINNNNNLIGLEEDQRRVCQFLLYDESPSCSSSHIGVTVIPICGRIGSGKTALARLVFDDPIVAEKFQIRKWIDVPDKFEIECIFKQIIDSGYEWMLSSSEEQLLKRIEKILSSKKSLIVMDDIRSTEAWETLCKILPKLFKGSYVLVTTRVGHVAEYISQNQFQFVHNMKPLNDGDSLALFTKVFSHRDPSANLQSPSSSLDGDRSSRARFTMFTDEATTSTTETDTRFEERVYTTFNGKLPSAMETDDNRETSELETITKIVRCCDGSPQLIKDLALSLRSKGAEELEMVYKNIRACLSELCYPVYNELPDHLQPCFMYLGHFLEDQEIDPEKLSHLWMIEGLSSSTSTSTGESARGERMMDMTERYLRDLTLNGMVKVQTEEVPATSKKFKTCSFVEGMKNFCVSNCEQERFLKIIDLREEECSLSSSAGPRRLVIYIGKHKVDISTKVAKNIRSLRVVLRNEDQMLENELVLTPKMLNLKEFRVLRILDFDGIDFQKQKLPRGIFNLELLRYLSFKGCVLEELPSSISKLSYLQELDLRVEGLVEIKIPNVLGKMRRLKHLYFPLKFATQNGENWDSIA